MRVLIFCVVILYATVQAAKIDFDDVFHMRAYPGIPIGLIPKSMFPKFEGRIVGGQEATPHQFPYQVALYLQIPQGVAFCGGSLLNEEWILTAAHCAKDASNFTAYFGAHNIRNQEPDRIEMSIPRQNKVVHPQYNPTNIENDIALLKLPIKLVLNNTNLIDTIALPSRSQEHLTFVGENSVVSGWGKDKDTATGISSVLRFVENPIISNADCKKGMLGLGPITDTNICQSGANKKSSCNGDSGGPLTVYTGKNTIQIGIVSFGLIFGCEKNIPGAYTRVTSYLDFIQNVTGITIS